MKLVISSDDVHKYAVEYMDTFEGFISIKLSELNNYDLKNCEEIIAIQKGIWLPDHIITMPIKISIANIEQLTCERNKEIFLRELSIFQQKCTYKPIIYDYSLVNCNILDNLGFITKYHPHSASQKDINFLCSLKGVEKEYDIGFVGAISQRRLKIINEIASLGVKVLIVTAFGEIRDIQLAKCKYLLNIRWSDDYEIFNSLRCNRWLQSGYNVISEESLGTIYNSNLFIAPYDELVNYAVNLIKNTA
jgi:hypothetical protein